MDELQILGRMIGWKGINTDFLSEKLPPEDESIYLTDADNVIIKDGRIIKLRGTDYLNSVSTKLGEASKYSLLGLPIYRQYDGTKVLMAVTPSKLYELVSDETWTERGTIYTDKAIGTLNYDNLAGGPFQVGEIVTAAGGTTSKVATDDGVSQMTLEEIVGLFNDDEEITGGTSGATADVNHPDGSVGVDGFIKNGAFVHDVDPPNDWTALNCTLATIAGGQVGNCLEMTHGAGVSNCKSANFTLEEGKTYKLVFYGKDGDLTGKDVLASVYKSGETEMFTPSITTSATWQSESVTFKCSADGTWNVYLYGATGETSGTLLFDEVALYELGGQSTDDSILSFANADDKFYFTLDESSIIYEWDGSTFQVATLTAESVVTLRAKFLLEYKTFLILLNTNEDGTAYPQRFWASNPGVITTFSVEDKLDLEVEGIINGAKKLENSIIVYFDNGIYEVTWQEGYGWTHRSIVDGIGLYCPKTLTGTKDVHHWISQEGLMEFRKGEIPRSISDSKFDKLILRQIDPVYYYRTIARYYPHLHQLFISYPKSGSTYNDTQIIYDTSSKELISKKTLLNENYSIYGSYEKDLSGLTADERQNYGFGFIPLLGTHDGYVKEQKIVGYQDGVGNYVSKTTHPPTFWKHPVRNKRILAIDLLIEKYTDEDITFVIQLANEANENYEYSYSITGNGNTGIRRYTIRTDDNGNRIDCRGKEFVPQIKDENNPYGWELHSMIFRGYYSTDK